MGNGIKSKKKGSIGEVTTFGEIVANNKSLHSTVEYDILKPPERPPEIPYTIGVEIGATVPIQPYLLIKVGCSAQVPIDLRQIDINDAYDQIEELVFKRSMALHTRLKEAIMPTQDPQEPNASETSIEDDLGWGDED